MSEQPPKQNEDIEMFANWGNELFAQDGDFADMIITSIIKSEYPNNLPLDKTE